MNKYILKSARLHRLSFVADIYHLYCKYAGVVEDMADRIFFSLTPSLSDPQEAARFNSEEEPEKFMRARRHLISSMEDLCNGVIERCKKESEYFFNYDRYQDEGEYEGDSDKSKYESYGRRSIYDRMKNNFSRKNIAAGLNDLITMFRDFKWETSYGGIPWANITKNALGLYTSIQNAKQYRALQTPGISEENRRELINKEREALNQMIMYANIIDGISHNTGEILPDILTDEMYGEGKPYNYEEERDARNKLKRLMDAKELNSWQAVRDEVLPEMRYNQSGRFQKRMDGFRDFIDAAMQNRFTTSTEERNNELVKVDLKKKIQRLHHNFKDKIIDCLESSKNILDFVDKLLHDDNYDDSTKLLVIDCIFYLQYKFNYMDLLNLQSLKRNKIVFNYVCQEIFRLFEDNLQKKIEFFLLFINNQNENYNPELAYSLLRNIEFSFKRDDGDQLLELFIKSLNENPNLDDVNIVSFFVNQLSLFNNIKEEFKKLNEENPVLNNKIINNLNLIKNNYPHIFNQFKQRLGYRL